MPKKLTADTFIQKAQQVHGGKYDYSLVEYKNNRTKVEIICPEHQVFFQMPREHLRGRGCPECAGTKRMTKETFIRKARQVHGSKYDYERVEYINNKSKVEIICPEHGSFWQTPNNHISRANMNGCPRCRDEDFSNSFRLPLDVFLEKVRRVHGDKYDYSMVQYENGKKKIEIICPEHGSFYQTPNSHLNGHGCPRCFNRVSKGEQELADALKAMGLEVIQSYRKWHPERTGLEIDIYLPDYFIGVEYNGEYWHRDIGRDREKIELAKRQGLQIITVWESEWESDKEKVLKRILSCLEG